MEKLTTAPDRILSVDFFRGFTMFMLVAYFGQLFDPKSADQVEAFFGRQLEHADWSGLMFWDLIQPFFMFIVGVSMPFAFTKKWEKGVSWNSTLWKAAKRSLILLFLGWLIGSSPTHSSFTNVLAQLGVTYFVAFLFMRKPLWVQLVISIAFIILTDTIYQLWNVPGFDQAYGAHRNFGSWFDIFLTGSVAEDRWVSFNAVPTTAHTMWGVICGYILMKEWPPRKKLSTLFIAGAVALLIGYLLSIYIPIIKRLCTSSFIFVSGGWSVVGLAISYWLIDLKRFTKLGWFFAVVGMNPLFIYLFSHSGGKDMLRELINPVTERIFLNPATLHVVHVVVLAFMLWLICYFLYRKRIFIRI